MVKVKVQFIEARRKFRVQGVQLFQVKKEETGKLDLFWTVVGYKELKCHHPTAVEVFQWFIPDLEWLIECHRYAL